MPYGWGVAESRAPQPRRAAVVYNPTKVQVRKLKPIVGAECERLGWAAPAWFATTAEDAGQAATRSALRRGASVVLAAGGDGTVRAVAEGLRGSGVPIALLPSGTGNLLARNLELPITDVAQAVEIAFSGADRAVDLGIAAITRPSGEVSEHVFLVMAGLGLDAKMIKNTSTKLKKAVGWLAYIDGIARSLPELKPVRLHYRVDGGVLRSMNVHTIIVGNCGVLPGGFLLMPDALPDDGILDIAALRPRGPFGWAKVWQKVAWENGVLRKSALGRRIIDLSADVRDVAYLRARTLGMTVDAPQEFQLDGDEFGEAISVHTAVDAGALTVKVPA